MIDSISPARLIQQEKLELPASPKERLAIFLRVFGDTVNRIHKLESDQKFQKMTTMDQINERFVIMESTIRNFYRLNLPANVVISEELIKEKVDQLRGEFNKQNLNYLKGYENIDTLIEDIFKNPKEILELFIKWELDGLSGQIRSIIFSDLNLVFAFFILIYSGMFSHEISDPETLNELLGEFRKTIIYSFKRIDITLNP